MPDHHSDEEEMFQFDSVEIERNMLNLTCDSNDNGKLFLEGRQDFNSLRKSSSRSLLSTSSTKIKSEIDSKLVTFQPGLNDTSTPLKNHASKVYKFSILPSPLFGNNVWRDEKESSISSVQDSPLSKSASLAERFFCTFGSNSNRSSRSFAPPIKSYVNGNLFTLGPLITSKYKNIHKSQDIENEGTYGSLNFDKNACFGDILKSRPVGNSKGMKIKQNSDLKKTGKSHETETVQKDILKTNYISVDKLEQFWINPNLW